MERRVSCMPMAPSNYEIAFRTLELLNDNKKSTNLELQKIRYTQFSLQRQTIITTAQSS